MQTPPLPQPDMENQLFNLKFASKTLVRQSKKCEKDEKAEKKKLKQAIEKQNVEGAKIYAQNAIRKKNEGMNYLRLSSRIDAVASRLDTANGHWVHDEYYKNLGNEP